METDIIIDSGMKKEDALRDNPRFSCPSRILFEQQMLALRYWSFDGRLHEGQLVVHRELADDIREIFRILSGKRFPIARMIPIAHEAYLWDDNRSMHDDNTSAFNYRTIAGTDRLSWHAYGRAIDINPRRNPYIRQGIAAPEGAAYDLSVPGTIAPDSLVVRIFKERGFVWGGEWDEPRDYQHFEKPFEGKSF